MRPILRYLAAISFFAAVGVSLWWDLHPIPQPDLREPLPAVPVPALVPEIVSIRRGDTLGTLLKRSGVPPQMQVELIAAAQKQFDVRKLRVGSQLTLFRTEDGILDSLEYVIDSDHKLRLSGSDGAFVAQIAEIPGVIRPDTVCATLEGSLFESIAQAGERPELAIRLAEIFAWDLDFYRDPRAGDTFCILVEKKLYDDGSPATYRSVLAAQYSNAGKLYDAYLYPDENGEPRYFSATGQSLQAAFLRSPLEFDARVSSQFSRRRYHPVLHVYRPHWGTD